MFQGQPGGSEQFCLSRPTEEVLIFLPEDGDYSHSQHFAILCMFYYFENITWWAQLMKLLTFHEKQLG